VCGSQLLIFAALEKIISSPDYYVNNNKLKKPEEEKMVLFHSCVGKNHEIKDIEI